MWKQNRSLFAYFRFMGYVMMIVGIYLIVNGIKDYAEQSRQKDWLTTQATVTDVSSEVVSSSPGSMAATAVPTTSWHMSMPWTEKPIRAAQGVCHRPSDWYCHYCEI